MRRFGQLIGLKSEKEELYRKYHSEIWPEIESMISECNIHNYSIFLFNNLLFAYFEYTGSNFEEDMARMAADKMTQEWWEIMKPMQAPLEGRKKDEWWADMEEVFHKD